MAIHLLSIIFIFLASHFPLYSDYPIYILLTHPRATGTAFEKVMRTVPNIQVLHAPFIYPYLLKKYGPDHAFTRSLPDKNIQMDDVKDQLIALSKHSPLFLKESAYLLIDFIKENPDFYQNPNIKFGVLVRDPAKSVLSYYRKMPSVSEEIVGHRQLWELYSFLKERLTYPPVVIDSDEFLKNPLLVLKQLGEKWELQFGNGNLKWEKGYANDWHLKDWYIEVAESDSLGTYKGDLPRDADGIPSYLDVSNEVDRQRLKELYLTQLPYYQKLLEFALKHEK